MGDDILILIVAGDIRKNVIAVLTDTLNLIKTRVTEKTEYSASVEPNLKPFPSALPENSPSPGINFA